MPISKQRVKIETRVVKISANKVSGGRLKATELSRHGSRKHVTDASQVGNPCDSQSRREKLPGNRNDKVTYPLMRVPVVSATGTPLMPTSSQRAKELIKAGKAQKRFSNGIFYIKLTQREEGNIQKITCGIDSGSKREGITVKSAKVTYINVLSDAVTTVKDKLEVRRNMRRGRRFRKTPCRKNRYNRKRGCLPPSTKSRWQAKLRIIKLLLKLYPITVFIVEDIKAQTKPGKGKWNRSFSPLETGKNWFYSEIRKLGELVIKQGYETKELRDKLGLKKTKGKLEEVFSAHNVDSWVLANSEFEQKIPDNTRIFRMIPLNFYRRQLHALQPGKSGNRRDYGGTLSLGVVRGTVIKSRKYGYCYIGGNSKGRLSGHSLETGSRLSQNIKLEEIQQFYRIKWRSAWI